MKIEEAQISLGRDVKRIGSQAMDIQRLAVARRADHLMGEIAMFVSEASAYLGGAYSDLAALDTESSNNGSEDGDHLEDSREHRPEQAKIPLPSTLGQARCKLLGAEGLLRQELRLRTGQANDALHEVCIALANKAMLFWTNVCHASSHTTTSQAWGWVNAVDAVLSKHAAIYRRCRRAMVNLSADEDVLTRYQLLKMRI
jgi:hypothetical protein